MDKLQCFEVGKLYNPNRTRWPECSQFNFRGGFYELVLFFNQPSAKEVQLIKNGLAQFALFVEERMIFLLYKFGGMEWSDAPYSWWRVREDERTEPETIDDPEMGILLQIFLVDAATGIIRAMRAIGLSHEFSTRLRAAITNQMRSEIDSDGIIARVYERFPTPDAMIPHSIAKF